MSPEDSVTGTNRNSIKCKVSQERENAYLQWAGFNPGGYELLCFSTEGSTDILHTNNEIK